MPRQEGTRCGARQGQTPQCGETLDQFFFYVLQSSTDKEREIVHLQQKSTL